MGSSGRHGRTAGVSKVLAAIANDWQVSGVFTGGSGAPYDVDVLVPDRRREREPDGLSELSRAHPYRRRHRLGLLERSVRAVQRERVRRPGLQQPRRRVGGQPAERVLGQDDRPGDCPQHSHRRQPAVTVPAGSVQRVQCGRDQRAQHDDSVQQPGGGDDDYEQPVQR